MAAKLLLSVSNDQATVAKWRRRRLNDCERFDNNDRGWAAFAAYLEGVHGMPVHVIVDTVEEDFRFETLPHIRGRDRAEMVDRKLKQLYRATNYFSYALEDRESGKRRDDRYLFAALTNPEVLVPWLRAIEAASLPVSGIYPAALVSASLVERLKLKHPNLLVISKNAAGLRQTFFKQTKFRISRLTPLGSGTDSAEQHYADEISNTRMYLDALTVTHVDDTLEIVIVDQDGSLSGLPAAVTRGRPNMHCQYLDINAIHARVGVPLADLEAAADALQLHLLGEQAPVLNLAPAHLTRTFQRFAAGRWVYAASGAILAGAALWSGVNVFQAMRIDQDTQATRLQTQDFHAKYQQVTAQFPDAPTTPDNLRRTVEMAEQIRAKLRTPEAMFAVVSHALDATPEIELQRLEWHYSDVFSNKAGVNPALATAPDVQLQRGIVYGEVTHYGGDYRSAMSSIQNFLQAIARDNAVDAVKVLKLPLDIRSSSGLTGSTKEAPGRESARFEVAVIFKNGA